MLCAQAKFSIQETEKDLRCSDCAGFLWGQSMKIVSGVAHSASNAGLKTQKAIEVEYATSYRRMQAVFMIV